ncbi:hypothetical protein HA378_33910, partial [Escherichia coli]|nr:hypothetical protein [Escherichia coli]
VAFLLILLPFFAWYDGDQTYALINLDINPSIEMKVNDNMEVLELVPLNEDARSLLGNENDWKSKSLEEVAATIIEKSEE